VEIGGILYAEIRMGAWWVERRDRKDAERVAMMRRKLGYSA
jgi:hypothetical protein